MDDGALAYAVPRAAPGTRQHGLGPRKEVAVRGAHFPQGETGGIGAHRVARHRIGSIGDYPQVRHRRRRAHAPLSAIFARGIVPETNTVGCAPSGRNRATRSGMESMAGHAGHAREGRRHLELDVQVARHVVGERKAAVERRHVPHDELDARRVPPEPADVAAFVVHGDLGKPEAHMQVTRIRVDAVQALLIVPEAQFGEGDAGQVLGAHLVAGNRPQRVGRCPDEARRARPFVARQRIEHARGPGVHDALHFIEAHSRAVGHLRPGAVEGGHRPGASLSVLGEAQRQPRVGIPGRHGDAMTGGALQFLPAHAVGQCGKAVAPRARQRRRRRGGRLEVHQGAIEGIGARGRIAAERHRALLDGVAHEVGTRAHAAPVGARLLVEISAMPRPGPLSRYIRRPKNIW